MFWCFDEPSSKRLQKVAQFVKNREKSSIWPNVCNFWNKLPCPCILINFLGKSCKKCLISWENTKNHRFGQNLQLLEQTTMFLHFHELLRKRLEKVVHFVKKHEKWWIWSKLATFWTKYHVFTFRWTFRQTVAKTASFREKARKLIDLAKTMQLFQQATMSFSFWWTFKKKVAKSASSREKARKIIDFVNLQLSEKTTMFWRFDEHCSKKLQKAARAVKKHEKSSIWPNLCKFSNKLRCFCISMNFQGKSCQKCFVSWKSTKNRRFVENSQPFQQTTMFWRFGELLSEKLQKVLRFLRKLYKSSIGPRLATFSNKVPCLFVSMNFSAKGCKKCLVSWKSTKNHRLGQNLQLFEQTTIFWHFDELFRKKMQKLARFVKKHEHSSIWPKLATSRRNYHVLAFGWLLQEKVAKRWKKWLISWKMTKNHRFGLNLQLFEETTMFRRFCQLFSKKWVISWKSTKNRHSKVA